MVHDDLDPWLGWLKLAVFSVVCWGKPCWIVCESCLIFLTSCHHSAGLKSDIPQIFFTCTHTPVTTYKAFHNSNSKFVYSVPNRERSMLMSVSVPLSVCLCQWAYLWVSTSNVHWIFCACYLWSWLHPLLVAYWRCSTLCTSRLWITSYLHIMARNSVRSDVKKACILKVTQQRAAGLIVWVFDKCLSWHSMEQHCTGGSESDIYDSLVRRL